MRMLAMSSRLEHHNDLFSCTGIPQLHASYLVGKLSGIPGHTATFHHERNVVQASKATLIYMEWESASECIYSGSRLESATQ
jgi:hypothetical protein